MSSSASTIAAGATSGYHVLKIKGYSFIKSAFPNGKYIESRTFRVAGHTWAINYYPNGITSVAADYVPFYLRLCHPGAAADVRVKMVFTFIDEVEMQAPSYVRARTPRRFVANNTSWGYEKFIKRENLERSERFKGDCFTVRCDIIVAPHFRALLQSGQGADVRFRVGSRTFPAHRCVLAARSLVFSAELYGGMKESAADHVVEVDDVEADVFRSLLHFIYTDSLPPEMEGQGEVVEDDASASMAQDLLVAADRYGMERLKVICEEKLCCRIDTKVAGTILVLAEQHHCRRLKEACFDFLDTLDAVVATDGFQNLAKSFPFVLFELIAKLPVDMSKLR
ncbi:LOW QUALITY PROTEIN: BTB/POZ and MATH domain-containing protein 2 [Setaria viridis]|uniref:LOW QUALITY PROTEIN: BTB/POZ and MATH domain-containing protein 2 n=1 Tax=Setaria viridis TaxID=4556 RepID=UPI003B3B9DF5